MSQQQQPPPQPPPQVMPPEMMQGHPGQPMPPPHSYYPENQPDLTGGLPLNLDSLRDGPPGSKPFYPYSTLIRYAIKGAPNQKLLLEDIYYAIESRFPYFRTAPPGWKNSVRHNLSLNPCFEKVPRPLTDRGKGSYWTVNDNVDPRTGVHRVRKKKPKAQKAQPRIEEDVDYHPSGEDAQNYEQQPPPPPGFPAGPPPPMDQAGPSNPPPGYPPPHFAYDAPFAPPPPPQLMPPPGYPPLFQPDEQFEFDEHGNVNWQTAWLKELSQLQQLTEEQTKAGVNQEWYRMMLFRVRSAMLAPPMNPGEPAVSMPPPPMPPPPNEVRQE
ncbi:hypothetical protein WOLCODRAFT_137215 [Wolfiporia cocos MD-104 SS10]|uniref:Fork-head domain-containing protein n=1 Tax=Wolfiporia cocos (strain MD-104) TaxID=742152 RepID=A0A2H3JMM5_WOLCO|nr:hypothetical protein WOLCODRAFT_137215 [Wolfiporia cocos MD-104 SS10]